MTTHELLSAVMALKADEQLLLVEQLLEQLSPESTELSAEEFAAELQRRKAEFEQGTAAGISWESLRDEARLGRSQGTANES